MTKEQQEKHFEEMISQMRDILLKKGADYSNADKLSNFKLAGSISGLNAELNCLSLISTKVARLGVLLNSKSKPNNESIQDSVLDLANYSVLLSMILSERDEVLNVQKSTIDKDFPNNVITLEKAASMVKNKDSFVNIQVIDCVIDLKTFGSWFSDAGYTYHNIVQNHGYYIINAQKN